MDKMHNRTKWILTALALIVMTAVLVAIIISIKTSTAETQARIHDIYEYMEAGEYDLAYVKADILVHSRKTSQEYDASPIDLSFQDSKGNYGAISPFFRPPAKYLNVAEFASLVQVLEQKNFNFSNIDDFESAVEEYLEFDRFDIDLLPNLTAEEKERIRMYINENLVEMRIALEEEYLPGIIQYLYFNVFSSVANNSPTILPNLQIEDYRYVFEDMLSREHVALFQSLETLISILYETKDWPDSEAAAALGEQTDKMELIYFNENLIAYLVEVDYTDYESIKTTLIDPLRIDTSTIDLTEIERLAEEQKELDRLLRESHSVPQTVTTTPRPSYRSTAGDSGTGADDDPYDAASYRNEEDFYYDHYDDFFDYYDAEKYYREHHD